MYHISRKYLGDGVVLTPQIPTHRNTSECALTKRICVAPTIYQCLLAIDGIEDLKYSSIPPEGWFVYHTKEIGVPARDVFDVDKTQEHWLLESTYFKFTEKVFLDDKNSIITREYNNMKSINAWLSTFYLYKPRP